MLVPLPRHSTIGRSTPEHATCMCARHVSKVTCHTVSQNCVHKRKTDGVKGMGSAVLAWAGSCWFCFLVTVRYFQGSSCKLCIVMSYDASDRLWVWHSRARNELCLGPAGCSASMTGVPCEYRVARGLRDLYRRIHFPLFCDR